MTAGCAYPAAGRTAAGSCTPITCSPGAFWRRGRAPHTVSRCSAIVAIPTGELEIVDTGHGLGVLRRLPCVIESVWVGEMATFDAFALATAIGVRSERVRLKIGPLAIGVRSPVAIALGVSSVATLAGRPVDVALGASSPAIVGGWHDQPWAAPASRMAETVPALRSILAGERAELDGRHVRTHGFRLRCAHPDTSISVAAFGPAMTKVAARLADEVVLNLVPVEHVAGVRARIDAEARVDRELRGCWPRRSPPWR
jgi:hypothetical protein